MRTNWTTRWFHLQGFTLTYYETNKLGVGQKEKGKIDLASVIDVGPSKAPGIDAVALFELEIVADSRTYRFRAPNNVDFQRWTHQISKFAQAG